MSHTNQITGKSVKKCYASFLNDCDGSISKEHPFAQCGLLALFGTDPIDVIGWGTTSQLSLTAKKASSHILCEKHNGTLSKINGTLKKWIQSIEKLHSKSVHTSLQVELSSRELSLILLQIGCGIISIWDKFIPDRWVQVLFSMISYDLKLYQSGYVGQYLPNKRQANFQVLEMHNHPVGCVLTIKGFTIATFIDYTPPSILIQERNLLPANKILRKDAKLEIVFK